MNYEIHITGKAEQDLTEAADYIEFTLLNPKAAADLLDKVDEEISKLTNMPEEFKTVDDPILSAWGIRLNVINNYLAFLSLTRIRRRCISSVSFTKSVTGSQYSEVSQYCLSNLCRLSCGAFSKYKQTMVQVIVHTAGILPFVPDTVVQHHDGATIQSIFSGLFALVHLMFPAGAVSATTFPPIHRMTGFPPCWILPSIRSL